MKDRKKLMILIDWFYPGYKAGGPIQSCTNLVLALKDTFSIYVVTRNTDHLENIPYPGIESDQWTTSVIEGVQIVYLSKANQRAKKVRQLISEVQPDFVYLNLMFSPLFSLVPLFERKAGRLKAKVIMGPRGALFENALAIKRFKKTPFLKLFRIMGIHRLIRFHATNQLEKEAVLRHFPGAEVFIADNLPKLIQEPFRSVEKQPGHLKMLFIARIHPIKNLLFLLQRLETMEGSIELNIIGPLEDEGYWTSCQAQIRNLPPGIVVNYLGAIPNHQLAGFLEKTHLFVSPTKGENFGHSIFESILAGRPVLISDLTPWRHLEEKHIGWDISLKDESKWAAALSAALVWNQQDFDGYAGAAWKFGGNFIANPRMTEEYTSLLS
ncbi:glycosyltransferase [Flavihumibacter petaseus]|uniref:Putative glycosyltransferase n=1 Tax=Flavihumibacter petaseus NBRC 106054 TaxID=1220578 RepID=A0A0E9N5F7_9BACT|nr:glycosyltransferase [Flavihumibacter petaseus]GAO45207.1 putative glycosyltransferase [Flavihumibacter petaseus NBRC 106054]